MSNFNRNHCEFAGHITADPEIKTVKVGDKDREVCEFSVAVNEYVGKGKEPHTTFIPCEAWDGSAKTIVKHFKKGSAIFVEGRIKLDRYGKEGEKKQLAIVLVVQDWAFVDSRDPAAPAGD